MCQGYFKSGRPKVDAFLFTPPNLSSLEEVEFLLDTGADVTALSLKDAFRLGLDLDKIVTPDNCVSSEGIDLILKLLLFQKKLS